LGKTVAGKLEAFIPNQSLAKFVGKSKFWIDQQI
jgi:hypothetical protein